MCGVQPTTFYYTLLYCLIYVYLYCGARWSLLGEYFIHPHLYQCLYNSFHCVLASIVCFPGIASIVGSMAFGFLVCGLLLGCKFLNFQFVRGDREKWKVGGRVHGVGPHPWYALILGWTTELITALYQYHPWCALIYIILIVIIPVG